jgi:hypothetical protein
VTLTGARAYIVTVPNTGVFTLAVAPGSYTAIGHSPRYNDDQGVCSSTGAVSVSPGTTVDASVLCVEK